MSNLVKLDEQLRAQGREISPPPFSEDALAIRFTDQYGDELRYVAMLGKWFRWDGQRWQQDDKLMVFSLARKICRAASAESSDRQSVLASGKTIAAVERLARCDQSIAATIDQWDADPWLLNTPAGIVDLKTGEISRHDPDRYMTKVTAVGPDSGCSIGLWRSVLETVTGNDKALQDYLQRLFGYSLTGSTQEHSLHFCYGRGANGKSTVMNAVTGCAGDYHKAAPVETFTASSIDRHPTELAGLMGARLVTATETEEGRRWAESRIKALTGGDPVSARFMRQDFFEYVPQFTLIISGNHKPSLRTVDEAIRRRFHLIPFTVTIPLEDRDPELGEKLKAEWPGILQWMIDGCVAWQEQGLAAPEAVTNATKEYLEAEDALAAWIDECCDRDPNAWEQSSSLFKSWRVWAERSGEQFGNTKQFRDRLEARGIEHKRQPKSGLKGYQGLRLNPDDTDQSGQYWNK
jgi:putative DNA primase/helicase